MFSYYADIAGPPGGVQQLTAACTCALILTICDKGWVGWWLVRLSGVFAAVLIVILGDPVYDDEYYCITHT